ncbi:MAG: aminopeptidase P N-terminal domain-containing protein [Gemmatimonadota bacterium]
MRAEDGTRDLRGAVPGTLLRAGPGAVASLAVASLAVAFFLAPAGARAQRASEPAAATPEQRYTDWAHPIFAPEEYRVRRRLLVEELKRRAGGIFLLPSADGSTRGGTFRQLDDFWYFTGLETPASLLAVDGDEGRAILFLPTRDARFENPGRPNDFPGRLLGADPEVAALAGLPGAAAMASLPDSLREWAARRRTFVVNGGAPGRLSRPTVPALGTLGPLASLILHLLERHPTAHLENGYEALAHVRGAKRPGEIRLLRRAARVTAAAIVRTAGEIRPGVDENHLRGVFEAACRDGGAQRIPFTPIIKSGPNSLWPWRILAAHYDRRNRTLEDGELVIQDVGCEVEGYVSDVGRTFPVSGRFTSSQREKLEMATRVSDTVISAVRPGVTLSDLLKVAYEAIPDAEEPYMQAPVFFGHPLGLSTSDPILPDEPLRPGMVFTVEPWYYNHARGISVFIEDVVLVTEDGAEVLTAGLPRSPGELEGMVGGGIYPP